MNFNFETSRVDCIHFLFAGSKLTYMVAIVGGHITAHLSHILVVIRLKTKQNSIWPKV